MSLGKKILNGAYPFNRGVLNIQIEKITICLPILKLSAVNMQVNDIYVIQSLDELNVENNKRLNFFDYQLIESDTDFIQQFELFKRLIQEQFSTEKTIIQFQINSRVYIYNNQNINATIL